MNRVHKSQVREILVQITNLKNLLNETYRKAGEEVTTAGTPFLSTYEEIAIKKALAELNSAINNLTGVI